MKYDKSKFLESAKAVRRFIAENPNKTSSEIYAHVPDSAGTITYLQKKGLITFSKPSKTSPAQWVVIPQ